MQEYDRAIADYDEAIRLDPESRHGLQQPRLVWRRKQRARRGLADYNEAIRLDPKLIGAYFNRGHRPARPDGMGRGARRPRRGHPTGSPGRLRLITPARRPVRDPTHGAADAARAVLDIQGWREDLSMYAVLLGHFGARRDGQQDRARSLLDEAASRCDASAWPYPIIKHLRGELDEAGLLAAAASDGKRAEARCYLGLEALENGRERRRARRTSAG